VTPSKQAKINACCKHSKQMSDVRSKTNVRYKCKVRMSDVTHVGDVGRCKNVLMLLEGIFCILDLPKLQNIGTDHTLQKISNARSGNSSRRYTPENLQS
jgi:hypothetical protein